ncbi:MAG TPA: enoyl-CoA hydratase/isomerase family protein [Terrimesophilobacter sp.]|nr:enoyl-CoA hydratase/isomerase family protein [Terrimesophilobacter sp.]
MAQTSLRVQERADRVHVVLNRPEVRNAIDQQTVDELHAVCESLESSPRVLIISGEGGTFASGADIAQLLVRGRDDALKGINTRAFDRIAALPMPVIAAVDGFALGGGAELAYAADFRLASTTARFGNPEVGLGIIAAAGATWRLPQLVGETLAKQVLLAGRILDADEALAAGLVVSVHDPGELLAAADALADRILKSDPAALAATKRMLAPGIDHPAAELAEQAVLFESEAKRERMTAFLERKQTKQTKQKDKG